MSYFAHHSGQLCAEQVPLARIAAEFGTPCYVYSKAALTNAYHNFDRAFADREHLICYAVKANSNIAILNLFARLGSGFDIVSDGELARVLKAGGDPRKIVFSGVGKSAMEMRTALDAGILCFNVESESELAHLDQIAAALGKCAPVSLRVNPDVDAKTHPYISTGLKENKFGVQFEEAHEIYRRAARMKNLHVAGIDCHIGSQLTEIAPFIEALEKILGLLDRLQADGINVSHLDLGGGLGICYRDETPPDLAAYAREILARMAGRPQKLLFEPGRYLVGNAGLLLTRVEYLKHNTDKNFAVVDAAMNDLMRPALYDAYHEILPIKQTAGTTQIYDIVGPVCESGDFLGHGRSLALNEGDLLAVMSAGAYGMSMSSNYNTRPRAAEVMVNGEFAYPIRLRETLEQLFALERTLP